MSRVPDATTSRVLQLLSLLQTRRAWTGPELADRIGVTERTIRRDIDRLRSLDYRIEATRGSIGGYRLEAGSELPPLVFSSEEAVALAVGLRAGATDVAVADVADLTVSVLAKLEQVLPAAVRARVRAVGSAVSTPSPVRAGERIDPETIAVLALACRDAEVVRFGYPGGGGVVDRRVEPAALVPLGGRWYLLAWDRKRVDWRTFRLDRMREVRRTHLLLPPRRPPGGDAAAFVAARFASRQAPTAHAVVRIAAPHAEVAALLGPFTSGLEPDGPERTRWTISADRVEQLAGALAWLVWPFEVVEGEELQRFATAFAGRLADS